MVSGQVVPCKAQTRVVNGGISAIREPAVAALQAIRWQFLDLTDVVIETWGRAGFAWPDLVDGFGGGDGAGLPPLGTFQELAEDVVTAHDSAQAESDLRRLMRSRLYRRHRDVDRHSDFINGDEGISRSDLIAVAVWNYLYDRFENEYVEPVDEPHDDGPAQLLLPIGWASQVSG